MRRTFFAAYTMAAVASSHELPEKSPSLLAQLDALFDTAAVGKVASSDTKGVNKRMKDAKKTPYDREKEA